MLSLKDFKEFEIKSIKKIVGGDATSHATEGADYTANGNLYKENGYLLGCGCPGTSYSIPCCNEE